MFPKTAKDYLNHLHSKDHADVVKKATESPWHENNQNVVSYAKIMPILHLIYRTSVAHVIKNNLCLYLYSIPSHSMLCNGILKQIIKHL